MCQFDCTWYKIAISVALIISYSKMWVRSSNTVLLSDYKRLNLHLRVQDHRILCQIEHGFTDVSRHYKHNSSVKICQNWLNQSMKLLLWSVRYWILIISAQIVKNVILCAKEIIHHFCSMKMLKSPWKCNLEFPIHKKCTKSCCKACCNTGYGSNGGIFHNRVLCKTLFARFAILVAGWSLASPFSATSTISTIP